jgi:hypothetical protein
MTNNLSKFDLINESLILVNLLLYKLFIALSFTKQVLFQWKSFINYKIFWKIINKIIFYCLVQTWVSLLQTSPVSQTAVCGDPNDRREWQFSPSPKLFNWKIIFKQCFKLIEK